MPAAEPMEQVRRPLDGWLRGDKFWKGRYGKHRALGRRSDLAVTASLVIVVFLAVIGGPRVLAKVRMTVRDEGAKQQVDHCEHRQRKRGGVAVHTDGRTTPHHIGKHISL